MALQHILSKYPVPTPAPCRYTGLFKTPLSEREWSDKPNKNINGVSYTQFADAYDVDLGFGMTLFDMIHGNCAYFADYFWYRNPEWTETAMMRGNSYDSIVHVFCTKTEDGRTLFADARGITDDPVAFFTDFRFGKEMYIKKVDEDERVSENWFTKSYINAYEFIYGKK